jgi:hypothetical protein
LARKGSGHPMMLPTIRKEKNAKLEKANRQRF